MRDGCPRLLAWTGGLLCLAGVGLPCVHAAQKPSPPVRPAHAQATLRPWTTLEWSITAAAGPVRSMSGQSLIAPTGTVELGPYGSVRVAGLSLEQAQHAIEKHLALYVRRPRVRLRVVAAPPAEEEPDRSANVSDEEPQAAPTEAETLLTTSALEAAEMPARELPAQSAPGVWQPFPRSDDRTGAPIVIGTWRPLERDSEPNTEPVPVSRMRLLPPAPR